jgi:pimeloyl-ACP methyl ester carboxylesterase
VQGAQEAGNGRESGGRHKADRSGGRPGHRAGKRRSRTRFWIVASVVLALCAGGSVAAVQADLFSDNCEPMSFGQGPAAAPPNPGTTPATLDKGVRLPTDPNGTFTRANRLPDGTEIGRATVHGKKSGFTGDVWVWAPKEYSDPRYARSGFPVLVALPGSYGFPVNYWMGTDLKLQQTVSELSEQGKSLPFIVVMPVLNPDNKHYYDGSDIPGQPKMGTWMAEDVPDFVKSRFRTFTSRDGWAFMGSSSGGFVALKTVLKHPESFKAVIASGPETRPDSPLWKGHPQEFAANNPEKLAERLITRRGPDVPEVYVNFQIGTKESGRANLEKFMRTYGKGPLHTTLRVIEGGGHDGRSYVRGMREGSLEWISKVLLAPAPDAGAR